MKKLIYLICLCTPFLRGYAQNDIDSILANIVRNNKTLQAAGQLTQVRKLEAKTGNYLANPTIEFNQLWGSKPAGGNVNEMAIVQSFDFPSVYTNKNKLAKLKAADIDHQHASVRQQILLTAQQTCLEIIYLRKQKKLFDERLENAGRLYELYRERLEQGDANRLELNKIQLELLNCRKEARLNEADLKAKTEQLQTLNGGQPLDFRQTQYPPLELAPDFNNLEKEYLHQDPQTQSLADQIEIAGREIRLSKAETLPKFDLGYRRNGGSDETLNGFVVGLSIPLFENKNTVRKAKAQFEYSNALLEDNTRNLKSSLLQLYEQAVALRTSCKEYGEILSGQQEVELLNKALQAGQISLIDYFVELATFYDSRQNYLDVEKEYYIALARLYQYKL